MIRFNQRSNEINRERLTPLPSASGEHEGVFDLYSSSKGLSAAIHFKLDGPTAIFFNGHQPQRYALKRNLIDVFTFDERNRLWGFNIISKHFVIIDPAKKTMDSLPVSSPPHINSIAVTDKVAVVGDVYTSAEGPEARLCEYFYNGYTLKLIRSVDVPGYHLDNLKPTSDHGWLCSWIWDGEYRLLYLPPNDNRFFDVYQTKQYIKLMGSSPSDLYYVLEDWEKGVLLYTDDPRKRWFSVQMPNTASELQITALEVMVERVFVIASVDGAFCFMDLSRARNPLISIFRNRVKLGRAGNELLLYGGKPIRAIEVPTYDRPAIPPNQGYLLYSPATDSFQPASCEHDAHSLSNKMIDMPNHNHAQRSMSIQNQTSS